MINFDVGVYVCVLAGVIRLRRSLDIEEPRDFIADHPFSFLILDNKKNLVVFVGRCMTPDSVKVVTRVSDEL
jgi:serine protease inhibitor